MRCFLSCSASRPDWLIALRDDGGNLSSASLPYSPARIRVSTVAREGELFPLLSFYILYVL